jgi:hypothetical protein
VALTEAEERFTASRIAFFLLDSSPGLAAGDLLGFFPRDFDELFRTAIDCCLFRSPPPQKAGALYKIPVFL